MSLLATPTNIKWGRAGVNRIYFLNVDEKGDVGEVVGVVAIVGVRNKSLS